MAPKRRAQPTETRAQKEAKSGKIDGVPDPTSSEDDESPLKQPATKQKKPATVKQPVKKQKKAAATTATVTAKRRGRPSALEVKVKTLLNKTTNKVYVRIAAHVKSNKQTKNPPGWPGDEELYHLMELDELPSSYNELLALIQPAVKEIDPNYELVPKKKGMPVIFAHELGSSTLDKVPFLDDSLKRQSKFFPITADASLNQAFTQMSNVVQVEEDPCSSTDDEDDSSVESDVASVRLPNMIDRLLLDLFVFVFITEKTHETQITEVSSQASDTVTTEPKLPYDEIKFNIMPLVVKQDDSYLSGQGTLGDFTIDAATVKDMSYGEVRAKIALYARQNLLEGYATQKDGGDGSDDDDSNSLQPLLHFGKRSGLFVSIDFKKKTMDRVRGTEELQAAISKRAAMNTATKKVGDKKIISVRVALAKMRTSDNPYSNQTLMQQLAASQEEEDSPPSKKQHGRSKRAAGSAVDVNTRQQLQKLYTEEASPFYHGFHTDHAAIVTARCTNQSVADEIKAVFDAGGFPNFQQLWGDLLNNKPEEELPKKNRFPPLHDNIIPRPPLPQKKSISKQEVWTSAVKKLLDSQNDSKQPAVSYQRCFFQFRKRADNEETDVRLAELGDSFTGSDLLDFAMQRAIQEENGIFSCTPEENDLLQNQKATFFLAMEGGPKFSSAQFRSLKAEDLKCFFTVEQICVKFEVYVHEKRQQNTATVVAKI